MGKKREKKGKLPKTIAGVKIPKAARKQAEQVIAELNQPIVREIIAGALGIAATALVKQAGTMRETSGPPKSAPERPPAPEGAKSPAKSNGEQLAEFATGMAVAGLGALFGKLQQPKPPEPPKAPG